MPLICSDCGRKMRVGQWPYCPHGTLHVVRDRWFGFESYEDRYVAEQPVEVTSPGHRARLMKERGLEVREREHLSDLNHRRFQKGLPPLRS